MTSIQKCNQICSSLTGSKVTKLKASKLKAVFNQEVSWDQAATWLRQHSIIFLKHLSALRHTSFWAVTMYYIYLSTYLPIYPYFYLPTYLSTSSLPTYLYVNQSIYVHLSIGCMLCCIYGLGLPFF